jgi:hypothetical protein
MTYRLLEGDALARVILETTAENEQEQAAWWYEVSRTCAEPAMRVWAQGHAAGLAWRSRGLLEHAQALEMVYA